MSYQEIGFGNVTWLAKFSKTGSWLDTSCKTRPRFSESQMASCFCFVPNIWLKFDAYQSLPKSRGFKRKLPRPQSALLCCPESSDVAGMRCRSRRSAASAPSRRRQSRRCRCRRYCARSSTKIVGTNIRKEVQSIWPFADVSFWSFPRRIFWRWKRGKWISRATCWVHRWFAEKAEKNKKMISF